MLAAETKSRFKVLPALSTEKTDQQNQTARLNPNGVGMWFWKLGRVDFADSDAAADGTTSSDLVPRAAGTAMRSKDVGFTNPVKNPELSCV